MIECLHENCCCETWENIDRRKIPEWYDQSKFGIFIHWGIYSVPAWAPKRSSVNVSGEAYAEWYGQAMTDPNGQYWKFHNSVYGDDFKYEDFAPQLKGEMFEPEKWADLFYKSGAKYVVLTAKHHDAFCLWPSQYRKNWNSVDVGIRSDVVGELAKVVRSRGMKMGVYYSLLEWFNLEYKRNPVKYSLEYMIPQLKELVSNYSPSVLFTDGEWEHTSDIWHSTDFLKWLFEESAVKDEIVVNDRWGSETRGTHGGYFTTEYGEVGYGPDGSELKMSRENKWEENRGIGTSFGFNRNENLSDYLSEKEVIYLLIDTVSRGGNLLLNVGPAADGTIPVIMEERLLALGEWLKINGEAIYNTSKWRVACENQFINYTAKGDCVYAICKIYPQGSITLSSPLVIGDISVELIGSEQKIKHTYLDGKLSIDFPECLEESLHNRYAYVLKIRGIE